MSQDIRWVQRFQNFEKSMKHLKEGIDTGNPDLIQKAGSIQFFEMSFELAWNLLKDYLEEQGFSDVRYPRAAIKKAFETGLIEDGHSWLQMLEDRNHTSHIYDEIMADEIGLLIKDKYYPLLNELYSTFRKIADER